MSVVSLKNINNSNNITLFTTYKSCLSKTSNSAGKFEMVILPFFSEIGELVLAY